MSLFGKIFSPQKVNKEDAPEFTVSIEIKVPERKETYVVGKDSIPENEKKYYQPDEYYLNCGFGGLGDEVQTFHVQNQELFPSRNGLYPAEILLLHYCTYKTYPHPKNGFPGFWWYEYGIRDVVGFLGSLEVRGFIRRSTVYESIEKYCTVSDLKEMLKKAGFEPKGKKADLMLFVEGCIDYEQLLTMYDNEKYYYVLTPLGEQELSENEYIPYAHKQGGGRTVILYNRFFRGMPPNDWNNIIDATISKQLEIYKERHKQNINRALNDDPVLASKLMSQDAQLNDIHFAEQRYKEKHDIDELIEFWQNIWDTGGLKFNGSQMHFRLPDLYIQQKRYDDALCILKKIEKTGKYVQKVESYRQNIMKLKS